MSSTDKAEKKKKKETLQIVKDLDKHIHDI